MNAPTPIKRLFYMNYIDELQFTIHLISVKKQLPQKIFVNRCSDENNHFTVKIRWVCLVSFCGLVVSVVRAEKFDKYHVSIRKRINEMDKHSTKIFKIIKLIAAPNLYPEHKQNHYNPN